MENGKSRHDGLVHKLMSYKFPNYLVQMVTSFLSNRSSSVSINNSDSPVFKPTAGVLQGSPWSLFLYNIYGNDVPVPKNCKIAIYADDTALIS